MSDAARPLWLTIPQALDRIKTTERCDRVEALRQLVAAGAGGEIVGHYGQVVKGHLPHTGGVVNCNAWRHVACDEAAIDVARGVMATPGAVRSIAFRTADIERVWPPPPACLARAEDGTWDRVTMPPLIFIEPGHARKLVCAALLCSGDEADRFLCDRWRAGEIKPHFTAGEPPAGTDPSRADWFAGAVILPGRRFQRRALDEWNDDPEWQEVPGQSFPFLIDRRELETALKRASSAPAHPTTSIAYSAESAGMRVRSGGLPDDAISFAQAIEMLAPIIGRHYPERDARRAIAESAADERLTGYARSDHAQHYDKLDASLWKWCKVVENGRGNYGLSCNYHGIVSASRDIHFSRADVERLWDYLIETRNPLGAAAAAASEHQTPSPQPTETHTAPERRTSTAVQAMRDAYKLLVDGREITTATTGKERFNKVRDAEEVKKHIKQAGSERGLSQDTFEREVLRAEWPGKPQIPLTNT